MRTTIYVIGAIMIAISAMGAWYFLISILALISRKISENNKILRALVISVDGEKALEKILESEDKE